MEDRRTATYRKLFEPGGVRYQFFCDVSGALVCTTDVLPDDEPVRAWKDEAKKHFSRCQRCGRWVSDPMYNAETMQCVQCSPWEEQPAFCPQCGKKVAQTAVPKKFLLCTRHSFSKARVRGVDADFSH